MADLQTRLQQVIAERNKAREELAELRLMQIQDRAAQLEGLPLTLADRVQGSTLDEARADARRLKSIFNLQG